MMETKWQDFRGKGEGVLVHLDTSTAFDLPIRDSGASNASASSLEPNYESNSFGLLGCTHSKARNSIHKNKRRYLLFGTRYQGKLEEFAGRFLLIGYMRLDRSMDLRKRHMHSWMETQQSGFEPECFVLEECIAFQSDMMNFYHPKDSFELTEKKMKAWGYKGKITKQMKLTFTEERIQEIMQFFSGKTAITDQYIKLQPRSQERKPSKNSIENETKEEAW